MARSDFARSTPKLEDHPLSAVATHSIYSQLPSTSRGRRLHLQPKDRGPHTKCMRNFGRKTWREQTSWKT